MATLASDCCDLCQSVFGTTSELGYLITKAKGDTCNHNTCEYCYTLGVCRGLIWEKDILDGVRLGRCPNSKELSYVSLSMLQRVVPQFLRRYEERKLASGVTGFEAEHISPAEKAADKMGISSEIFDEWKRMKVRTKGVIELISEADRYSAPDEMW
ncbi:hypothetical protein MMC17_003949 [Xylographa soralifera]|nr:hypothetical protein [Xylographa soralifera]